MLTKDHIIQAIRHFQDEGTVPTAKAVRNVTFKLAGEKTFKDYDTYGRFINELANDGIITVETVYNNPFDIDQETEIYEVYRYLDPRDIVRRRNGTH